MGIDHETDRTLFIRNLDSRVTEEILFELFLQAGPLIKTKIPRDQDGRQKTFGFAVYKHEMSVPYAVQLLNGVTLFGRTLQVNFRSGSTHGNSPGNAQESSTGNIPSPHGHRAPILFNTPMYTPPHQPQMTRSFSSPDSLQKHAVMNNMWQAHAQQLDQLNQLNQLNGGFAQALQSQSPAGGNSAGARPQNSAPHRQHSYHGSGGRSQRYPDDSSSGRHQQHGYGRDNYHHGDRSGNRQHDNHGGHRHHDDRGSRQDNRWRRY